jgi:hypothetical protein
MMKRMLAGRSSIMFIVSNDCHRSLDGLERTILSILCILSISLGRRSANDRASPARGNSKRNRQDLHDEEDACGAVVNHVHRVG